MVGVQDIVKCPQCGFNEACYELQTRTMEEDLFCPFCGYSNRTVGIIDRKREKKEGELYFKLRKDGKPIYRQIERKGLGAYDIRHKSGVHEIGALTRRNQNKFIKWATENAIKNNYIIDLLTVVKNGKVKVLIDNRDKPFPKTWRCS